MPHIAIIGAGPAGLIAAETLAEAGHAVTVFDRMPSVARKFLIAGRGGLNLTHSEPLETFLARYRPQAPLLLDAVRAFPPAALIAWCEGLGVETFVGSSGRIFPKTLKASPLLRAWLARLAARGVAIRPRHRCIGLAPLRFATPEGEVAMEADAVILACGGASWPRLGSDGGWTALLPGLAVHPFAPSNVGFAIPWSAKLAPFFGAPLKRIALTFEGTTQRGEAVLTATGIEGGAVYALSAPIREAIARDGSATFTLDLRPDIALPEVRARLASRGRGETVSATLRKALNLPPVAIALVQEARHQGHAGADLATLVKALPLTTRTAQGLERAISSAGGLDWGALDARFMLRAQPGVFACGEMLDWEAPTGGYLLQACFATGIAAARGCAAWLEDR
ncbi:TIGR03862 family flavoprotein [Falsiroseomonas oryziterrae]|uniref:TIGR03862 family flavoprotein n=1 Tax=Falsiroseomonas oryziterrae TaxID=2911368 RepID=UPI001F2007AB|nr:TIGR03862 family flavoprotein [Roseomonas sp. NPKOSM-4]